jgi:hypothetical protein
MSVTKKLSIRSLINLSFIVVASSSGLGFLAGLDMPIVFRGYLLLLPIQILALTYFLYLSRATERRQRRIAK